MKEEKKSHSIKISKTIAFCLFDILNDKCRKNDDEIILSFHYNCIRLCQKHNKFTQYEDQIKQIWKHFQY